MKRTAFDQSRDERVANDVAVSQTLLCAANGCPNRWSVDAGQGRCCSAHAWAGKSLWPQITQEQVDAETDRARANAVAQSQPVKRLSPAEKRAILSRIAGMSDAMRLRRDESPRAWAYALRERENRGEELNDMQRDAWRRALGAHGLLDRVVQGMDIPAADITTALQETGDLPAWADLDVPAFDEEEA
jgi:hypothetical protein